MAIPDSRFCMSRMYIKAVGAVLSESKSRLVVK
jgi:hypothetical protein